MTRLTSISLAGTIGKNYYGIGRDPGVITKTIGTASRDYSTIALWEADLNDETIYVNGDEVIGECYNDSTFSINSPITINTSRTMTSITLTAPSSERHDGTSGTGCKLSNVGSTAVGLYFIKIADPNVRVEFLELEFDSYAGYDAFGFELTFGNNVSNCDINGCLFHSLENGSVSPSLGIYVHSNKANIRVDNNFFITMGYCMRSSYGGGAHLYNNSALGSSISNRSMVGIDYINYSVDVDIRNNIITNFQTVDIDTGWTIPPTTNATSDSSGQTTGIDPANHFVSTVAGSEDLHLLSSSSLAGAGQVLTAEYAVDIDGLYRGSVWDIGADQTPATVTKSIGTSGRDYSTMAAWEADLDTQGVYANGDSAVGECYNDSDFLAGVTINGGSTVGLAGVTLTAQSGERHDGTAGTGVRIVSQTNGDGLSGGFSGLTISFIEVDFNSLVNSVLYGYGSTYRGLLIHNGNLRNHVFYYDYSRMNAFNNTVYDMSGSRGMFVIRTTSSQLSYISNNTCYNIQGFSYSYYLRFSNTIGKNNIAVNTSQNGFTYSGSPTVSNNMSSDGSAASGADSIINADPNTQFISVVSGSEDLHLAASSDAIKAGVNLGTTPEGIQYDIDNRARGLVWDIGSDQAVSGHVRRTLLHVG